MAASRGQTPPANLKERIAALQQRSVSPNTHQSAQALPRGLLSSGSGGLRDRIAKFEEKGGMPVPRGSFGMGAPPQLAENAPPKKRGELYGNCVPGLGRPSGGPAGSRSGSPLPPPTDDAPGPRKRCISTGTGLSSTPPSLSTDEPVPALPNGVAAGSTPRRNSLAVNFGSGRRVVSASDVESETGENADASTPSSSSLVPGKPPDAQPPIPVSPVEATPLEEEEQPQPSPEVAAPQPLKPSPVVEVPSPADSNDTKVDDAPAKESPVPGTQPAPLYDVAQNVSQSPSNKDAVSVYESAPQSAVSQPSLPPSVPTPPPTDIPSVVPKSPPARAKTVVISLSPPPREKVKRQVHPDSTNATPLPDPIAPAPTPSPTTESRPQTKPTTFKTVVHRRVSEPSTTAETFTLAPPVPSQPTRQRRTATKVNPIAEATLSPGIGDLAVLLEDAALLELRLTGGGGTASKASELLEKTPTSATFEPDPRQASASTLTGHAPVFSSDSGSQSVRSVSIPSIREPLIDGEIPEGEETDGRSLASTTFSQRSPSHRKYLTNIYRLGRRSSSYMPGTYPRDSMSMSSEDSSPVTTPSDNGKRKGFGIGWPSASPKKGIPNVGRSSSFADKIFNRNRTKSNASTDQVSVSASERNSLYQSSQPSLMLTFPSELSPDTHAEGMDHLSARSTSWISAGESTSEFSPASSLLDKDIFDAFPSVPQTLPPGYRLDADDTGAGRASTLPVNGRKQVNQRLSMA